MKIRSNILSPLARPARHLAVYLRGVVCGAPALIFALILGAADELAAHEFWLEPQEYQVPMGGSAKIDLRNGEDFEGVTLSWFDRRIAQTLVISQGRAVPYEGLAGDLPAIHLDDLRGLVTIAYASTLSSLTYTSWDKVMNFVRHKDFPWFAEAHLARGLGQNRVTEGYWRYSKTLIAGGDGAGQDHLAGFETEFLALTNPYAPDFDGEMRVRLIYRDAPRADAQVELWRKSDAGDVTHEFLRTDARGEVRFRVSPGASYQIDAVVMRPAESPEALAKPVMWETLWANMTFGLAGGQSAGE